MATKKSKSPQFVEQSFVNTLVVLALIVLVIIAMSDHGVRARTPLYVATAAQDASQQTTSVVQNDYSAPDTSIVEQPVASQICQKINDYQLQDLPELSVEPGGFLHVQWFVNDGDSERESVLPSGRYLIKTPLRGHVWEYSPTCTPDQVLEQVAGSISRRLEVGADNAGYAPWKEWLLGKGLIEIVKLTSSSVIPAELPNPTK